jgi:hypothetical protein
MKMMKLLGLITKLEVHILLNLDTQLYKHPRYYKSVGGGRIYGRLKFLHNALYFLGLFSTRRL